MKMSTILVLSIKLHFTYFNSLF